MYSAMPLGGECVKRTQSDADYKKNKTKNGGS